MTNMDGPSEPGAAPVYTRTGDDGTTTLGDLSRVSKTNARLIAYAHCEEANAAIGYTIALSGNLSEDVLTLLVRLQNDLFDVGADLIAPGRQTGEEQLRIDDGYIERLEEATDHHSRYLPPQRSFVLPGGTVAGALLHNARTVVRRAERAAWAAMQEHDDINPGVGRYLNRLSDLLFTLARSANAEHGDTVWQPGMSTRQGLQPHVEGTSGEEQGSAAER